MIFLAIFQSIHITTSKCNIFFNKTHFTLGKFDFLISLFFNCKMKGDLQILISWYLLCSSNLDFLIFTLFFKSWFPVLQLFLPPYELWKHILGVHTLCDIVPYEPVLRSFFTLMTISRTLLLQSTKSAICNFRPIYVLFILGSYEKSEIIQKLYGNKSKIIRNFFQQNHKGTIQVLRQQRGGWVWSENGNFCWFTVLFMLT